MSELVSRLSLMYVCRLKQSGAITTEQQISMSILLRHASGEINTLTVNNRHGALVGELHRQNGARCSPICILEGHLVCGFDTSIAKTLRSA